MAQKSELTFKAVTHSKQHGESCHHPSEEADLYLHREKQSRKVMLLTCFTMILELVIGKISGSMSLLADGWHMLTHVGAIGLTWLVYYLVRKYHHSEWLKKGPAKVFALSGFTNGLALAIIAISVAFEAITRFFYPEPIQYQMALMVTAIGLLVNLISAFWLHEHEGHSHHHGHDHDHHHDHNIKAAYAHVLADALTSIGALLALSAGFFFNVAWPDPLVAVIGAIVILKWSKELITNSARELLKN